MLWVTGSITVFPLSVIVHDFKSSPLSPSRLPCDSRLPYALVCEGLLPGLSVAGCAPLWAEGFRQDPHSERVSFLQGPPEPGEQWGVGGPKPGSPWLSPEQDAWIKMAVAALGTKPPLAIPTCWVPGPREAAL